MGDDVNRRYGQENSTNPDDTGDFEQVNLSDEYEIPLIEG